MRAEISQQRAKEEYTMPLKNIATSAFAYFTALFSRSLLLFYDFRNTYRLSR